MSDPLSHSRPRRISGDPVSIELPRPEPTGAPIHGRTVIVEPVVAERHGPELYPLLHGDPEREAVWDYLHNGPFASEAAYLEWAREMERSPDPLFFAIRSRGRERTEGVASLMEIRPATGVIEIGHINLSAAMQKTVEATEALFLLMRHALDDLAYRRLEWKCNALNEGSRRAAGRLGFSFEGIFYQHSAPKGKNRDTAWFSILDYEWPAIRENFERWLDPTNFDERGRQRLSLGALNRALTF
jgi:RimJ/RimL family protein N-acetyltransferase